MEYSATITRDDSGIPYITARSGHDAYFAMGWIHAQDRLWQMELQRRVGAGRLAEIVGEPGLKNDRFMRTLGLYRLAQDSVERLDDPTRNALKAYAEGVNAWINDNTQRLPPEFRLLRLTPEPWQPADSLVWARIMALQLTADWRDEALRGKLAATMPSRRLAELWPEATEGPVTIAAGLVDQVLATLPVAAEPHLASNVVAVSGKRSDSGAPLLANDPHLPFQAPSLWYLLSVEAPGLRLTGAMVPGVPFHLIGHNGRIAWGTTTTHADTVDLFIENLAGDDSYQVAKTTRPFGHRQEVITIKGQQAETLIVRESRHGPIISDLAAGQKDGQVVAFKSTALEPDDRTAQAMYRLGRTVDWRSFVAALSDFHAPVQNFAFADTGGNIGFITAGRIPVRSKGTGFAPVQGWSNAGEWTGWVPFSKLPQSFNPKTGLIVNANNQVTGEKYPFHITTRWPEGYRARRIEELLEDKSKITPADLRAMQLDTLSLAAQEIKELLDVPADASAKAREAAKLVASWDGGMDRDRAEPLIFNVWLDKLWTRILADELGGDLAAMRAVRPRVLGEILTVNRHWCDDVGTEKAESCDDLIAETLEATVTELSAKYPGKTPAQWRWGDVHQARFAHPILGRIPGLNQLSDTSLPSDGDDFTINRGSFIPGQFTHVHGPGLRVIFDLSDLSKTTFVLATGQSGNPLSRHYRDLLPGWQTNEGLTIDKPADGSASITLEPSY
nr:penicillin acylase family protein [Magnetospirillum sulfuroxidans]